MANNIKNLGTGLIILGFFLVGFVLVQLWFDIFTKDLFNKILISFITVGIYGFYIGMIRDELETNRYKNLLISIGVFGGIAAILIVFQTWFVLFEMEIFKKIIISLLILEGFISSIISIREDFLEHNRLKDKDIIN